MDFNKGVTPVIAVTLLLLVTVAAAGTLYALIDEQQERVEGVSPEVSLNVDALNIESCWYESGDTYLAVRNEAPNPTNNSIIGLNVEGQSHNHAFDPEGIIGSQETFEIELDGELDDEELIEIYMRGGSIHYHASRCS